MALRQIAVMGLLLPFATQGSAAAQDSAAVQPLLIAERTHEWLFDGSGTWIVDDGLLVLAKPGVPAGGIRRPAALALLRRPLWESFTLEAEVRSTADPSLEIADVLLVFGYESPTRFFYVHLSGRTDAVHNGIFVVHDDDRRRIDAGDGAPQLPDREWHRVRLRVDRDTGRIRVFVDDAANPGLAADYPVVPRGMVGFGSFDDTAWIRLVSVRGTVPRRP